MGMLSQLFETLTFPRFLWSTFTALSNEKRSGDLVLYFQTLS